MKSARFLLLSGLFLTCMTWANGIGYKIAQKMQEVDSGWQDELSSSTMVLRNARGQEVVRELRNKSLEVEGDGDKTLVVFDRPRDIKGTVFLTHSHKSGWDDQWLYLPGLKRVKRIAANNRSGPFMGSEFAYEDISSHELERFKYELIGAQACGREESCYLLNRFPLDPESGYSRQLLYVDMQHYRIYQIDYFDRKASLLKTLRRNEYQQFGRFWRARNWVMKNHQTNKSTVLLWHDRQLASGFSEKEFTANAMAITR